MFLFGDENVDAVFPDIFDKTSNTDKSGKHCYKTAATRHVYQWGFKLPFGAPT